MVSVTNVAKVMAGNCPYKVWKEMREPKKESPRLKAWKRQHEELVDFFIQEFKEKHPDWILVTEHSIEKDGISGSIDVLARGKNNQFQIWEIKTGKEYPYHYEQLNLYVAIEKMSNPDAEIKGMLKYIDREPYIADEIDIEKIWENALHIRQMLESDKPPERVKYEGCRWCEYHSILHCPK